MSTVTVVGSGKYFTKLQTIELHVTFNGTGGVVVESYENDLAVVRARVKTGEKNWAKWAGDTMDALARYVMAQNGDEVPSDAMFDAWHDATAIVWRRAFRVGAELSL